MSNLSSPKYLDAFTISTKHSKNKFEWKGQLISSQKNTLFRIRYYGQKHPDYPSLITGTSFAPAKLVAIDSIFNEEILLFDGCCLGYNALLCDNYSDRQRQDRKLDNYYTDNSNNQLFELFINCYYQIDYEQEYKEYLDVNHQIEILSGQKIPFETLKRNGFDYIQIIGINKKGETTEILSEELA
jgi:hypothetical protein